MAHRTRTRSPRVADAPDLAPCTGAVLADLDNGLIDDYRAEVAERRPGLALERLPVEELLLSVGAAVLQDGQAAPTLTGVLFFARHPQQFYPSLTITFLQFAGTSLARSSPDDALYLDNREFTGPIPGMIEEARAALFQKMSRRGIVQGFRRQDVTEYPEIAVREAILNAVAHRDYANTGSFIQIRLFADRLEVQSPGGLPAGITVDNLIYEQHTRNPHIVRLLEDYGFVERRGVGIDEMVAAMREAGLPPPTFEDRGTSFWVTLRGPQTAADLARLGLNDRQIQALARLRDHGRITNRDYQELFGVSERTALYDLTGLVDAGLILPVSSGRGRSYILRE